MFYFEKKYTIAELENEFEIALLASLLKKGDIIEMKIVRNIFIFRENKMIKVKRKETVAKIEFEEVKLKDGNYRIKGKIIEIDEKFKKGYHAENLKIGQKIKIYRKIEDEIFKYLKNVKRVNKILNIFYQSDKVLKDLEKIKEVAEWKIIDSILIHKDLVFKNFDLLKNVLLGNGKVYILDDKKHKDLIIALRRF